MRKKQHWVDAKKGFPRVNHSVLLHVEYKWDEPICGDWYGDAVTVGCLSRRRPKIIWEIYDEELEDSEVLHWKDFPNPPIDYKDYNRE